MEYKLLNEQQKRHTHTINAMIARGVMPSAEEMRAAGRQPEGFPEHLLRSVVAKNALIHRARAKSGVKVPAHVAAKLRSRVKPVAQFRSIPRLTQEQIDHIVENRDLEKYPLSGYEQRVLAERGQRRRLLLDF
jgi:hypothetical protein